MTLVLLAGCQAPSPQMLAKFEEAERAFAEAESTEDYLRVARMYQEIIDSGVVSGALLYNQGNAFMRAGQRGRAIARYRQAKRYRPRDPRLDANLAFALQNSNTTQRRSLIDHILFWQDWISYPGKFQIAAVGAVLTFLLGVVGLYARRKRNVVRRLAWLTLAVTLLLLGSAAYDWYRFDRVKRGVVIRDDVIARKGNASSYEPAFTEPLLEGTEFQVVERRRDWLLIRIADSAEGWIAHSDAVTY